MSSFSAGKEVLSYCGKCKLPLGHTIVSMKDSATIGKVECNTCHAVHMYKDPASKAKKVKSTSGRKKTTRKKAIKKAKKRRRNGKESTKVRRYGPDPAMK